jgi:hypothetical protein
VDIFLCDKDIGSFFRKKRFFLLVNWILKVAKRDDEKIIYSKVSSSQKLNNSLTHVLRMGCIGENQKILLKMAWSRGKFIYTSTFEVSFLQQFHQ